MDDIVEHYGHVIVDECHHLSAYSFEQVARHAKARFVTGLSATVTRKDGHHPIIFMQCGPLRYRVNRQGAGGCPSIRTIVFGPAYWFSIAARAEPLTCAPSSCELTDELVSDEGRTRLICQEIVQAVRDRPFPDRADGAQRSSR